MKEIELKIRLDPSAVEAVARHPALPGLADGGPRTERLRSVYYDTEDGRLAADRMAFRLRCEAGSRVQTVKIARSPEHGLSEATELSTAAPAEGVDPALLPEGSVRALVLAAIGNQPLMAQFETDMTRTRRRLRLAHLGTVELALDTGEIRGGGRAERFAEAEIELVSGSARAVFEAARTLFADGLRLSRLNKAERGALLRRTGRLSPEPTPRKAKAVPLAQETGAEAAARAVLAECLTQIAANLDAVREADDPEGPHQLRVGLRRLRSAFKLFADTLGGPSLDALAEEARWLGQEVGRLRDREVAAHEIVGPERGAPGAGPGLDGLADALAGEAMRLRQDLRATLDGPRTARFLLDLTEFVHTRGWLDPADWSQTARLAEPVAATGARALERCVARVERRGKGLEGLDIEARHALRKALKELRYQAEFLRPLFAEKRVRGYLKALRELQELFGDLNDAAVIEEILGDPEGPALRDPATARAAGYVLGVRSERARAAWGDAKAAWKAFRAEPAFWR
ncbi:MAG: CHAD domain-containing protein [Paracoccaceae bacterium]